MRRSPHGQKQIGKVILNRCPTSPNRVDLSSGAFSFEELIVQHTDTVVPALVFAQFRLRQPAEDFSFQSMQLLIERRSAATALLINSIRTVMAGGYWVGTQSVPNIRTYLKSLIKEVSKKTFGLTTRELQIVSAVVAGLTNKQIAQHFKIAEDTVKHHLGNIFDKTGVSSRLELALFAIEHKLPLMDIF